MTRLAAGVAVVIVLTVAWASPAAAHAELQSTEPIGGAVLEQAPQQVTLSFSEAVVASADSIRVYDGDGDRLDIGRPAHPEGRSSDVAASLPALDDGAYIVTWRVISADSHPVHGAFTFRVGDAPAGDTQALLQQLLNADGGSRSVGVAFGIVRFAAFAALIALVGGVAFLLVLWPAGLARTRRILGGAWVAALATTAAGICLQAVYVTSRPLGDALRASLIADVLDTRFGRAWLARIVLLVAAGPLLWLLTRADARRRTLLAVPLGVIAAAILVTPGIAGHPGADAPAALTVATDALHLGAVSFWLAGLALLTFVVLRERGEPAELVAVVRRFSPAAFTAVAVILATGLFQGWRQSRSVDAVTDTTYGRLLLIKLALFTGMVGLAALSRAWVRRRSVGEVAVSRGPGAVAASPPVEQLRRTVGGEALIAVVVLAVTALLVNTVPARTALAQPFSTELHTDEVLIDVTVDPAKAGPVDIHAYTLTHAGAVTETEELTIELSLPGRDIGPLPVPLQRAGPGHYAAYGFDIPIPGVWQLDVIARTSDIHQETATTTVRIR